MKLLRVGSINRGLRKSNDESVKPASKTQSKPRDTSIYTNMLVNIQYIDWYIGVQTVSVWTLCPWINSWVSNLLSFLCISLFFFCVVLRRQYGWEHDHPFSHTSFILSNNQLGVTATDAETKDQKYGGWVH